MQNVVIAGGGQNGSRHTFLAGMQTSSGSQLPPHVGYGPELHGCSVVVVVVLAGTSVVVVLLVVGGALVVVVVVAQPEGVQASQQLANVPTHAVPPRGGRQCAASLRTVHLVSPLLFV
jgi:hypothetical protein